MRATRFVKAARPLALGEIAALTGSRLDRGDPGLAIAWAAPPEAACGQDLTFLDASAADDSGRTLLAAACLADERHAAAVPAGTALLITPDPRRAYASALSALFPHALGFDGAYAGGSATGEGATGGVEGHVHPAAEIEPNVLVEPGAVVGAQVMIGRGSIIGAGAVIGVGVKVGRECAILPHASLSCALIGDRVVVGAGTRVGYGEVHTSGQCIPPIGRVIVQDGVEIGANSCINRGGADTVIGEGTRIGNLVQVGGGVRIGRQCVVEDQAAIAAGTAVPSMATFGSGRGHGDGAIAVERDLGEKDHTGRAGA